MCVIKGNTSKKEDTMPSTNSRNLTLTTVDSNVTVNVTYNAVFSQLERHLAAQGLSFRERISVLGVDPSGGTTGTVLHNFGAQNIPVSDGAGSVSVPRNRSITVSRASLQEDVAAGDTDEIRARIAIELIGFPAPLADQFTDQEVLLG
jgi:hypothetical protein